MRIGINAEKVLERNTGVGSYAYNLVRALLQLDREDEFVLFFHSAVDRGPAQELIAGANARIEARGASGSNARRIVWEQLGLPRGARRAAVDAFHYIDHTLSMLARPAPTAITVHDLAFLRHPEAYTAGRRLYKSLISGPSIRRADMVIAVSDYTRREVLELTGADPHKVRVVHNGIDDEFRVIDDAAALRAFRAARGLPERYILFVGTLQPRKNLLNLVRAFDSLTRRKSIPHSLVICGERGWICGEIFAEVERRGLGQRVRFIETIAQHELPLLYNCAELFVFPSLFEGFGLPLLEAMSCGVPVVSSNATSMPEVAGDAALLFEPRDVEGMAAAIERVLGDRDLAASLRSRGLARRGEFSWEKCAQQTLQIYREMVQ